MNRWKQLPQGLHSLAATRPNSVLLETARFDPANQTSLLFLDPVRTAEARTPDQIPDLFHRIEEALASGLYAAGYLSYEAGYHFERFNGAVAESAGLPLAWFGIYRKPVVFHHETGVLEPPLDLLSAGSPFAIGASGSVPGISESPACFSGALALGIDEQRYQAKIARIQEYIRDGDTYQVNFTDKVRLSAQLPADAVFRALLQQQPVAYSAFLNVEDHSILSLSPELFFRTEQSRIVTRPMKGTMPRGLDESEDAQAIARLKSDEKNRSEHVMIVDLLRNDLGRICTMGSVQVEDLFSVEKYETLLQMTSTISGDLRPGIRYYDIFKSMFPGGSITGAPKIRTMEIIREMEEMPRGIYTGAIGFLSPRGSSAFNVAIRTVVMQGAQASMGVGGGIVADSDPSSEYRECLLKASFLTRRRPDFQLLETLLWDGRFGLISRHLDRLESSAAYFDFFLDRNAVLTQLMEAAALFQPGAYYRVRLTLDRPGNVEITSTTYLPARRETRVRLATERTSSSDVFLRHKTTHRQRYDKVYAQARADGWDEVIFRNERGEVTEGAISNLFIRRAGRLLTPPVNSGALPGVCRRLLLDTEPTAEEAILTAGDLESADAVFLCNAVRGLRPVKSLSLDASKRVDFPGEPELPSN
ncbi:MAG TPA: aminodeoxychorismate synthase component I [Acidobacteriaceae bacterium]|nr:aminodeoxychorismate synthase component I [Acidobacteriaceae bacterium]